MLETSKQLGELPFCSLHCSVCCIALCACWNVQLVYAHAIALVASVLPEAINWTWTKFYRLVSKFLLSKIEFALSHGIHTSHSQKGHPNHEQKASQIHNPGRCASSLTSPFFVFPPCLLFWSCSFLHSHLPFTDGMQWVGVQICIIYSSPGSLEKTKEQEYAEAASGCRQHREFATSSMVMHFTPGPFGVVVGYILPRKTRHSLPAFLFPPLHIRKPYNNHQMNFVTHVMECNSL